MGRSLSGGVSVRETPPYGNVWAVWILLECILVSTVQDYIHHIYTSIRCCVVVVEMSISNQRVSGIIGVS